MIFSSLSLGFRVQKHKFKIEEKSIHTGERPHNAQFAKENKRHYVISDLLTLLSRIKV